MTKVLRPQADTGVGATTEEIEAEGLTTNRAGGPAYTSPKRQALVTYLTTGGVGNTYYADKTTLDSEARALFGEFAGADPEFLARATIYARTRGLMRSAPIEALAHLSLGGATAKRAFHAAFPRVIQTPGDLADFWTLVRGANKVRGVGRSVRSATNRWLEGMSAYHAIKYGATSQTMSLRDIYRMARPKLSGSPAAIASYLVKGEVPTGDLAASFPEQLRGYHAFKTATAEIETLLAMVEQYRLPWEVVSGQLGGGDGAERTKVWTAMSFQMPYMALLRNLNNLLKYGVLDNADTRKIVLGRLADRENVLKSKQFPFRFISAIRAVEQQTGVGTAHVRSAVTDALKRALDASVANLPFTTQHVLSVLDVSGSMSSNNIGGYRPGKPTSEPIKCSDIGAIFAAATYKAAAEGGVGDILTFDTEARWETGLHAGQSVYDIAQRINHQGGGTSLWVPIHAALTSGKRYDVMIFITDNMSWASEMGNGAGGYYGYSWQRSRGETASQAALDAYRAQINPDVRVFFVQLVPTTTQMTAPDTVNTWYIAGWSNSVLDYIALQSASGTSQLEAIQTIAL